VNLSNDDIQDILSLLDSLRYAEFTLETSRFTLQLRRSAEGDWTQETQVLPRPVPADPAPVPMAAPRAAPASEPARPGEPPGPGKPRAPKAHSEPPPPDQPAPPGEPPSPGHSPTPDAPPSSNTLQFSDAPLTPGAPASPGASLPSAGHSASGMPGADVRDIVSPLPGTFYRAPQPGARPFTEVGGDVEPGTVVAIIETMKLMNPVYAGTAGTVTQICLDDGQFAEQGTVLMRVRPWDR
jgi:biotin carboxyl carrier protein